MRRNAGSTRFISKKLLPLVAIATVANLLSARPLQAQTAQAEDRPNVLLIVTDDQPDNDATRAMLPVLDAFPLRFARSYATTPLCCPSRASTFSGRYAHNHGIVENDGSGFDADRTVQKTLHDAGYATGLVGKYLNKVSSAPHFDHVTMQISVNRFYGSSFLVDGEEKVVEGHMAPFLEDQALGTMNRLSETGRPWFLYVAPYAPHLPATPEPRFARAPIPAFRAPQERDLRDKPLHVRDGGVASDKVTAARELQLRSLASVNVLVTRLLERLEQLGEDNTLVVFTSDNGYMWSQHGLFKKRYPYEPSVRVPLYLRWPGHIGPAVSQKLVANIDIAATVFEITGVAPSYEVDGRSLFGPPRERLLLEYWAESCCNVPSWKATIFPSSAYIRYSTGEAELYDLAGDPHQLTNLLAPVAGSRPDVSGYEAALAADSTCVGAACP